MADQYQMSPLGSFLMRILRSGVWGASALLLLFAGILIYQRLTPEGSVVFQKGDIGFLGVLAVMMALAIYLVCGIKKEMEQPGGDNK